MGDYFDWLFSPEGQRAHRRSIQKFEQARREGWHAARFYRAADRHDRRIPHETRVKVLERANEHCESCNHFIASEALACLELHHLSYDRAYGFELPEDLIALCRDCHKQVHGLR